MPEIYSNFYSVCNVNNFLLFFFLSLFNNFWSKIRWNYILNELFAKLKFTYNLSRKYELTKFEMNRMLFLNRSLCRRTKWPSSQIHLSWGKLKTFIIIIDIRYIYVLLQFVNICVCFFLSFVMRFLLSVKLFCVEIY